ncbi:MAG: hypothetical protein QOJ52_4318 [Acidimicrobiaceae bacterium]|jgi:hypothetical protein|nr:hypothetical protein [Acidimicrobiaceae bacterium]
MVSHANAGQTAQGALRLAELLTVGDQTDETGRLLLEDSATSRARRRAENRGIPMAPSRCPYQDTPSRLGGRMNVSAYEALRADTTGILDGFAWLTGEVVARNPGAADTIQLLYDTSYLGLTVPLLLWHRADNPVPPYDSLPTTIASIFKASRGLFSVAVALLNDSLTDNITERGAASRRIHAAQVVNFAERQGHLVRQDPPRVCAAPTKLIERTISVILTGRGASASASSLAQMIPFPTLWQFYRVQDELSQALSTYSFVRAQMSQIHEGAAPQELVHQMVPRTRGTFGQLTEAMLAHATSAQQQLNRLLGRSGDAPALGLPQLLDLL